MSWSSKSLRCWHVNKGTCCQPATWILRWWESPSNTVNCKVHASASLCMQSNGEWIHTRKDGTQLRQHCEHGLNVPKRELKSARIITFLLQLFISLCSLTLTTLILDWFPSKPSTWISTTHNLFYSQIVFGCK